MKLYGRNWTRREVEARVGRVEQIGGIRRLKGTEGPEAEVEQLQIRTGAGLTYYVIPSKGMDISLTEFAGASLSWQSPNGDVHPAYYDSRGMEWLRTASGGLLMTCGLTQVGSPFEEAGQEQGLHGRAHHIPAKYVAAEGNWNGDEYELRARGVVEETSIFGEKLRLTREINSRIGENSITVRDIVENIGFKDCPHMLLYHFNFGFPLLTEDVKITFPSRKVTPRESDITLNGYDRWEAPQFSMKEQVYYHEQLHTDKDGFAAVVIQNPKFPFSGGNGTCNIKVRLSWNTSQLPQFVQWKMPGAGEHVLGIEPANCWVEGRAAERNRNTLVMLKPGESKIYELKLAIEEQF